MATDEPQTHDCPSCGADTRAMVAEIREAIVGHPSDASRPGLRQRVAWLESVAKAAVWVVAVIAAAVIGLGVQAFTGVFAHMPPGPHR